MDPRFGEWLHLFLRWAHVIAGIMWIGQTYLFNWMETRFATEPPAPGADQNVAGQLWMVHGGGFYLVEKQRVPELMPRTLYWFKWESFFTWLSGALLLVLLYYFGGLLVDASVPGTSFGRSAAVGLGVLALSWPAYDLLWRSALGRSEAVCAALCFVLVVALAYGLCRVLTPRAAYLHVGAMFGTVMAANVWLRILPAQGQMIAARRAGRTPDLALSARAGRCSKHNTFLSVPVVFIMISSHFPVATYENDWNWAILATLILCGGVAAKLIRDH